MITTEELDTMDALEKAATDGPWVYRSADEADDWELYNPETSEWVKQDDSGVPISDDDGKFIAASRDFVPRAIEEIRRLREALEKIAVDPKELIHS